MNLGSSKYLGLALGDRSIQAAQVRISRDRREVGAAGEFVFPDGLSWDDPAAVGKAFRQFLRQQRISASQAVVGVPARWLMAREKDIPPATASVAASALRLHAERDFPSDLELVYDYAGQSDPQKPRKVLLAAMLKRHMDRILAMADEAGLSLAAVTSSSLVLASASGGSDGDVLSLLVGSESVELVFCGQTGPRLLKHLAVPGGAIGNGQTAGAMAMLGGEVQRAVAMMPRGDSSNGSATAMLWDSVGLDPAATEALVERGGMQFRVHGDLSALGVTSQRGQVTDGRRIASAVALGLSAAGGRPAIDFLHTRLAPPKVRRVDPRAVLVGVLAAAIIGGLAWLWIDVLRKETAVAKVKQEIKDEEGRAEKGKVIEEKVKFASGWFEQRPPDMGCLRELTVLFPPDGRIIATGFTFHEDGKVEVGARTPEQNLALVLGDSLRNNKNFADVVLPSIGDLAGRFREAPFTVKFVYVGKE